jgi:hypothetical protein
MCWCKRAGGEVQVVEAVGEVVLLLSFEQCRGRARLGPPSSASEPPLCRSGEQNGAALRELVWVVVEAVVDAGCEDESRC